MVKNPPGNARDVRDEGLVPRSRRSSGGGPGNSLQYSCLENPMDRGARWATVPSGCKELGTTEGLSMHAECKAFWKLLTEETVVKIIVENFPKMGKEIITQVQETQRVP